MGLFGAKKQTETTEHLAINKLVDDLQALPPDAQMAVFKLIQRLVPSLSSERENVESLPWDQVFRSFKDCLLKIAPKMISPSKCWQRVSAAWEERLPQVRQWCEQLSKQAEDHAP